MPRQRFSVLILAFVVGLSCAAEAAVYTFAQIDVPGALATNGSDINDAGEIVGRFANPPIGFLNAHGFLRDAGGVFTTIDGPTTSSTTAGGINAAGQIVGSYQGFSASHGFL